MFTEHEPEPYDRGNENELRQLVERAQKGDAAVLTELRRLLDDNPHLWRHVGDVARHAEEALIGLAAGDNLLLRESLRRKLLELKAELAPNNSVERILVDRVAACWLAANHADVAAGQSRQNGTPRPDQLRRRQDSTNRRFLEAIKLLTNVRKLLGPTRKPRKGKASPGQE